jgi:F0F1-type ATP synthase membrane subunit c/vacuolar-type H+-ATPase subunit K
MYLLKIKKFSLNYRHLTTLAFLVYMLIIPASAFAASAPPDQKACDQSKGGQYAGGDVDACLAGYNGGHSEKPISDTCDSLSGSKKEACINGYGKGACSIKDPNQNQVTKCLNANPIIKYIRTIVNFLSAGVGIVITGSIIYAGIQYGYAGNNSTTISAAKKRIQDTLIALLAFFFIYAFLNWIIPGGLLFDI